ncbi:MAG: molecular chaperone DnaK [bacterium JZ-2024 1]
MKGQRIVGIDLGTTNSLIAVVEGGEPTIIPNAEGGRLTPSVVAFTPEGEKLVGEPAKRQAILNPEGTVRSIKRKMGLKEKVRLHNREFTPEEISAFILQKLVTDASSYLGEKIEKAVITVPAYFNNAQRQATKDAGQIAGLDVVRIINEPTAASLAYGLGKSGEQLIAVFDLGGGTFDISILEIGDGVFEVRSTAGNTRLGGDDMDQRIMDWILKTFQEQTGIDLSRDRQALQRIRDAAEKAKIELSTLVETTINLPFLGADISGPKHFEHKLSRSQFERMIGDLLDKLHPPCERAMSDAKIQPKDIDVVILVGGATRVPAVLQRVREIFQKEPIKGVNPDEAVALGAAIQASILAGEMKQVVLVDVTPLTLGVETLGGITAKLIPRNSAIPTRKSEIFTTAADNQTTVEIHIVQGEREMARDNISLGRFHLTGIPPAPRGIPQIEVTFEIDSNGILNVTAKDLGTGKSAGITVTGSSNLSEEELKRLIREAELHAEEDRKKREEAEARNALDSTIYSAEKILSEQAGRISPQDADELRKVIDKARQVHSSGNFQQVKQAHEELTRILHRISQTLYQQTTQTPPPPPPRDEPRGGTMDAEYQDLG